MSARPALLEETLAAHGGLERWRELDRIRVGLRCGGIAMAMKGRPGVLSDLDATLDTRRPRVEFAGLGTFDGAAGRPPGISRRLRWRDEDVLHFAGYALWNYLSAPFLFTWPGVEAEELSGRRLRVTFPAEIPTHSTRQTFHISAEGLIARHDYTAEVIGPWASAVNRVLEYETVEGLTFGVRRRVTPRGLPAPTLVSIAIDTIELG